MSRTFLAAIAATLTLFSTPAFAQAPPGTADLFGTRSLGMGNAFRGIASSNEALYLNPAGIAVGHRYQVDGTYGFTPGDKMRLLNVSVVDSKTAGVAAGVGYSHISGTGDTLDSNGSVVHFGLGFPVGSKVAAGVGFKYLGFSSPTDTNSVTADVGLLMQPFSLLSFGLVAYNVIDVASEQAPMRAGGGVALGSDTSFRLAFDAVFAMEEDDPLGTTYHAGGELLLDQTLPIRLGFERREGEDRNFVTGGVGILSQMAALEAAYAQGIGEGRGDERIISLTLKLFL